MEQIVLIPKIANRNQLASLKSHPEIGAGVSVVYVYFLLNKLIPYPKATSNILYLGEAMREGAATGVRFRQHITTSADKGADTGSNFVLSQYFHAGWDVGLAVFKTSAIRVELERDLIYAHIAHFGAPPIAQGKIPHDDEGRNCTTHIAKYVSDNGQKIAASYAMLEKIISDYGMPAQTE